MDRSKSCLSRDTESKWLLVRRINWEVCNIHEIRDFFGKFGPVIQVKKGRRGKVAFVAFEDTKYACDAVGASKDELVFKNQQFSVAKPRNSPIPRKMHRAKRFCFGHEWVPASIQEGTPIHRLPNELLDYIFTFLTIQERFRTELVCMRWRWVGKCQSWSEPKRLIFAPDEENKVLMAGMCQLTDEVLSAILARCGRSLRQLTVSKGKRYRLQDYEVSVTSKSLTAIGKFCCNLRDLEFVEIPLTVKSLELVSQGCQKLKTASFIKCGGVSLSRFFKCCETLETLTLQGLSKTYRFNAVNRNLKSFQVNGYTLSKFALQQLVNSCDHLEELRFCFSYLIPTKLLLNALRHFSPTLKLMDITIDFDVVFIEWRGILKFLKNLEEVHLYYSANGSLLSRSFPCPTMPCKNLRVLSISSHFTVFDDLLFQSLVSSNDKLVELDVTPCYASFPENLALYLKHPENIKTARFEKIGRSTLGCWKEVIGAMSNLEYLYFDIINDELVTVLAQCCPKLKALKMANPSFYSSISDHGLSQLAILPSLTILDIRTNHGVVTSVGIEALARQGLLEELYSTDGNDESFGLFAKYCPNFRLLDVSNGSNVTNNLVITFSAALEEGFLKRVVVLFVFGTCITKDVVRHHRLDLVFNKIYFWET